MWLTNIHLKRVLLRNTKHTTTHTTSIHAHAHRAHASTAAAPLLQYTAPPIAAYVHLPFCKRRCFYCDFPIAVAGNRVTSDPVLARIQAYVDTLLTEIRGTATLNDAPLQSVYFGGGTPSLVPPRLIADILRALDTAYGIAPTAEVTLEADPGTFDMEGLCAYKDVGINRFSVGVQSFQDELLQECGRAHGLKEVEAAIEALHRAHVGNWSLDLISGLPHLTLEAWHHSLTRVTTIRPPHVSVYDLQLEPQTRFGRRFTQGDAPLPNDDTSAAMFCAASNVLKGAGYEHYEISNYALEGARSVHNQVYWACRSYYAFGLGAASYLEGRRFARPRTMADYTAWVEDTMGTPHQGASQSPSTPPASSTSSTKHIPGAHLPQQTPEDALLDLVMLRLRTADGLDMGHLESTFGQQAGQLVRAGLQPHVTNGLAQWVDDDVVRLTDPHGFMVSNDVIADVFAVLPDGSE